MAVLSARRPVVRRMSAARRRWGDGAAYAILAVWMVFTLFPVVWLLLSSVKEPPDVFAMPPVWLFKPTLHNFQVVLGLVVSTELETVTTQQAGTGISPFPRFMLNTAI